MLTPAIALLLLIIALLVAAVTQWSRYLADVKILKKTADDTRQAIDHLTAALTEDFDGTDVVVSLREAKHYSQALDHQTQRAIDEIREELRLPKWDWPDREVERRKWLEAYHNDLLFRRQQQDEEESS